MIKQFRYFNLSCICILLLIGSYTLYGLICETKNISIADCNPSEGMLLANIDGEPYYYDPIYIFKLTDGAFSEDPTVDEKKRALFYELAYLESVDQGKTISKKMIKEEIELRKYNVNFSYDSLDQAEADIDLIKKQENISAENIASLEENNATMVAYVQRYYELWSQCTDGAGISEDNYWKEVLPYIKKGKFASLYCSERLEEYYQKVKAGEIQMSQVDSFEYTMGDFGYLVEKYDVEIIDSDIK